MAAASLVEERTECTQLKAKGWQVVTELAQSLGKLGLCQQTSIREGRREKRSKPQGLLYSSGQPTDDLGPSPDMLSSESSEVSLFSLTKRLRREGHI